MIIFPSVPSALVYLKLVNCRYTAALDLIHFLRKATISAEEDEYLKIACSRISGHQITLASQESLGLEYGNFEVTETVRILAATTEYACSVSSIVTI